MVKQDKGGREKERLQRKKKFFKKRFTDLGKRIKALRGEVIEAGNQFGQFLQEVEEFNEEVVLDEVEIRKGIIDRDKYLIEQGWDLGPKKDGEIKARSHSVEYTNRCTECGVDMGPQNPRQLCRKTYCENI